jgi:tyrosinase
LSATGTPTAAVPAAALHWRRSVSRLTAGQLQLLRDAFAAMKAIGDDRGYNYFAGIHGLPLPVGCDNAHGTPYFLPWHRAYLYFIERAMRDLVPEASLAWWDWRTPAGQPSRIPPAFAQRRVDTKTNPLYDAPIDPLARQQGRRRGGDPGARSTRQPSDPADLTLPTPDDVEALMAIRDFGSFTEQLEQFHNLVHGWVGGSMSAIDVAAFDPIFWGHHTMVDRIWRVWQTHHPGAGPPAAILDDALPPFRMTVRQTLSVTALGYDYAAGTTSAAVRG